MLFPPNTKCSLFSPRKNICERTWFSLTLKPSSLAELTPASQESWYHSSWGLSLFLQKSHYEILSGSCEVFFPDLSDIMIPCPQTPHMFTKRYPTSGPTHPLSPLSLLPTFSFTCHNHSCSLPYSSHFPITHSLNAIYLFLSLLSPSSQLFTHLWKSHLSKMYSLKGTVSVWSCPTLQFRGNRVWRSQQHTCTSKPYLVGPVHPPPPRHTWLERWSLRTVTVCTSVFPRKLCTAWV